MMRPLLFLAALLALVACGPTGPVLPCLRSCAQQYDCGPGEPNPACENARDDCMTDCHPPEPDRPAVGPSVDVLTRVARGELSPEEGARTLEIGRERRPVDVVSFEDAVKATREQPKGEP